MQDADSQHAAMDATPLPNELGACHALIVEQARAIVASHASREEQSREISGLKAYVERLLNQLYGRRSERLKFDPKQIALEFGDDPVAEDALADKVAEAEQIIQEYIVRRKLKKKRPPRSEAFPAHLERVEEVVEPPSEEKECTSHGPKSLIGFDTTETLEFERPKLRVRVRKYPKYVCSQQPTCGVTQAERPEGLVEGNRYDTSLAAEVIANKYAYHLPLYREQDLFARSGWTPSRSTLVNILTASAFVLQPLADYLLKLVLDSGGLGCDDTHVKLVVPPVAPLVDADNSRSRRVHEVLQAAIDKQQPSVMARMWAYRSFDLPVNAFDFTVSRHRDGPQEILKAFDGTLMADCYSGFEAVVLSRGTRMSRAACWAHARRKFDGIYENHPQESAVVLALILELYDVEDRASDYSAERRRVLRETEARPILDRLRTYLDSPTIRNALPKSDLARAANYLRNNWAELIHYVKDGRCPIDNNDTEQLMKQIALGRKAWLFVGSVAAGARMATLMTIVSSAHRNCLDVGSYLKDVLDQLLAGCTDYESLCPHHWVKKHPEAVRNYRLDERRDAVDRKRVARARRRLDGTKKPVPSGPTEMAQPPPTAAPPT